MKAIANRLRRLEDQLGPAGGKPRDCLRIVLIRLDRIPGLEGANVPKDDDAERLRVRERSAWHEQRGIEDRALVTTAPRSTRGLANWPAANRLRSRNRILDRPRKGRRNPRWSHGDVVVIGFRIGIQKSLRLGQHTLARCDPAGIGDGEKACPRRRARAGSAHLNPSAKPVFRVGRHAAPGIGIPGYVRYATLPAALIIGLIGWPGLIDAFSAAAATPCRFAQPAAPDQVQSGAADRNHVRRTAR